MDWRQRKTTQKKKKDWKMGGLIEVDGNDDNEEIAIYGVLTFEDEGM